MATIKVKQIKSRIGAPKDQKRTLDTLGLRKINQVVEVVHSLNSWYGSEIAPSGNRRRLIIYY